MRKAFIAGNFKMNKSIADTVAYAKDLVSAVSDINDRDILICPPFTSLTECSKIVKDTNILLGAQNMHFEESGAFTGEVSAEMLLEAGAKYVILGHSERRHIFKEDDELINKKVKKALSIGLEPILCVGEQLEERENGLAETVVKNQIEGGLKDISESEAKKLTIAYEPVWAIGTGKTAQPEDAEAIHAFIRKTLSQIYSQNFADSIRIQYGGSVKPENVTELMSMENIDGALVGGACLKVDSFSKVINF